jgi:hypothetical protein
MARQHDLQPESQFPLDAKLTAMDVVDAMLLKILPVEKVTIK